MKIIVIDDGTYTNETHLGAVKDIPKSPSTLQRIGAVRRFIIMSGRMPGRRYDIGNLESYKKVKKEYRGIC